MHPYMGRKAKAKKELEKLLKMVEKCDPEKQESLRGIAEHVAFVKVKLDEGRRECEHAGLIVEYDNGGGQKGEKENPRVKAYGQLLKLYIDGVREILRAMPDEDQTKDTAPSGTVLDLVMARRRANG